MGKGAAKMKHHTIPSSVQMVLHFCFLVLWGAQAGSLLPDGDAGHWIVLIAGSLQTVLAVHGIYTPPPPSRGERNTQPPLGLQ
jgi:hypothetical protein